MSRPRFRTPPARLRLSPLEDRVTPVANDLFADAEVLTGQTDYVSFGSNYDFFGTGDPFIGEPGEPNHAGVSDPIQSAWYRWTAPIGGRAYVSSLDFGFSGIGVAAAVYTGTAVEALTEVTGGTDPFGVFLTFDAVAGTTYSIAVDSPEDALIDFDVYVAVFEPPANDNFADAFVLNGVPAPVTVAPASSLSGSATEPGEPNHAAGVDFGVGEELTLGPSVWYSWTAPTTGRVTLDLDIAFDFGETFIAAVASTMAVYTGGSAGDLTHVGNTGDFIGEGFNDELRLSFDVTAGTTYRIAVAGPNSFPSTLDLKLINHAVPGAVEVEGTLFVVGTAKNDAVKVTPVGAADKGSTGVKVRGDYNGQQRTDTLTQSIAAAEFFLTDGHDTAELAGSLAFHVEADLGSGNNTFRGGRGDTIVMVGGGNNSIRTGDGVDWVFAGDGNNDIRTAGSDDLVVVGGGNNTIATGDGEDRVSVDVPEFFGPEEPSLGTAASVIDTGDGRDFVEVYSDGLSVVTTGAGNDIVQMVGAGNDVIRTGDGNDFVRADAGNNVIFAGAGEDSVFAGREFGEPVDGANFVDAGDGNDRVRVSSNGPSVVFAGDGNDDVTIGFVFPEGPGPAPSRTGPSVVFGGDGDDVLIGGAGSDLLDGGGGRDILVGGLGADLLIGGAGSDVLFDGTVTVVGGSPFGPPQLRAVFAAWDPANLATYVAVRSKLVVTPDTVSRDVLLGGPGIDWFWSGDSLDLLDLTPIEVKN